MVAGTGRRAPQFRQNRAWSGLAVEESGQEIGMRPTMAGGLSMALPGGRYDASRAVTLICTLPLSALETGQFSFASSAVATKSSSEIPGTPPVTTISDVVIPVPGAHV